MTAGLGPYLPTAFPSGLPISMPEIISTDLLRCSYELEVDVWTEPLVSAPFEGTFEATGDQQAAPEP
jgi:hypothetical protein